MVKFKVQVAVLRALLSFLDDAAAIAEEPEGRQNSVNDMVETLKKYSEGLPATKEVEVEMPLSKFLAFKGALRQIAMVLIGVSQSMKDTNVEPVEENG